MGSEVGVAEQIFPSLVISPFLDGWNTGYLLHITLMFDRCHSLAVMAPDKYEHDLKDQT